MTDWDPDYEAYYDILMHEGDVFGPYEEDYTGRPTPESTTRVGNTHHAECTFVQSGGTDECLCKEYWERDYQEKQDLIAEDLHEEYWT